jgi:Periplasmic copper-binding protein (NosD)
MKKAITRNFLLFITTAVVLTGSFTASADLIYVDTVLGNDSYDGTSGAPFATVQIGINAAVAGDTVIVRPGIYRERLSMPNSGTAGNPITLQGEPGAVLDGGDIQTDWEPAPEIGVGVYKKSLSYTPMNLTWNNKLILYINATEMTSGSGLTRLADPASSTNWDHIEALYGTKDGITYLRFRNGEDPDSGIVSTSLGGGRAVITIYNKNFITIRGFRIINCYNGIWIRDGASDNIIENNYIAGGKNGVWIYTYGGATVESWKPCYRNKIRNNEITLNFIANLAPIQDVWSQWLWEQFKVFSDNDREGVKIYSGGDDNEVYGNHIYSHWGGIQDHANASAPIPHADFNQKLKVYANVIHDILDDGLEPTGSEVDCEWYDNIVYNCNANLRIKNPQVGPLYIYRNRFFLPVNPLFMQIFFFSGTTAEIYLYHNTFSGGVGDMLGSTNPEIGGPNTWYVNNVFSTEIFGTIPGGFHFDYNWAGGNYSSSQDWGDVLPLSWVLPNNIIEPDEYLFTTGQPEFILPPSSTAIEAGIDLSISWTMDGVVHAPLPGMEQGYFPGGAPDMGALQSNTANYGTGRMEVEDMTLTNYIVKRDPSASGSERIKAVDTPAKATYTFTGTSANYNITVGYLDEYDGASTFRLYVNGIKVDEWLADAITTYGANIWMERSKSAFISNGDKITLEGLMHNGEYARIDYIEVQLLPPSNMMPNPSFESDLTADYNLGQFIQVFDNFHSGQSSIAYTTTNSTGYMQASTVIERLPVTGGEKLKVTVYAKTDNISGSTTLYGAQIKTYFYDSSGTYLAIRHSSNMISGTNTWAILKTEGLIPANATYASVTLRLYGSGTVWYDDLLVEQSVYHYDD